MNTQAQVTRQLLGAIGALERSGHDVKAVHIAVDGSMTVLTEAQPAPVASNDSDGDWVTLAGSQEVSRAQGA
jgi:hypothetical protein